MVAMDSFRTDLRERLRKPEILLRIAPSPASGELVELSGTDLVDSAERLAKDLVKFPPPGVALLLLPHSVELFLLQIGLVLQGYCPAILPWPTSRIDPEKYQRNLLHQLRDLPADQLITEPQLAANVGPKLAFPCAGCDIRCAGTFERAFARAFALDTAADGMTIAPNASPLGPDSLFLQFSGGTTGVQKSVVVTDRMLVEQLERLRDSLDFSEADGVVSWLPLYHDMGLIACLWFPLWSGNPSLHFAASDWLMNPELLFKYIADFRATFCWLPNFAFSYLAQRREAMTGDCSLAHISSVNREAGNDLGKRISQAFQSEVAGVTVGQGDAAQVICQYVQFAVQQLLHDQLLAFVNQVFEIGVAANESAIYSVQFSFAARVNK